MSGEFLFYTEGVALEITIVNSNTSWGEVDEAGRLVLSPEIVNRLGLRSGARVSFSEDTWGLRLHRPVSQLTKIYIEPSARCNLDCRTCIRNVWNAPDEIMAEATFDRVIADLPVFSPVPTLFFGGLGEPLTHPNLVSWVARARSTGARVELITNGTLLNERISRQLIEAGLDLLWVSIDGATPESYTDVRLGASLPKVLANLQRFDKLRPVSANPIPEIGITFVAMRRNIADLPAIMEIGKRVGASRLLVSNVLPYTPGMQAEVLYSRVLSGTTPYQPSKWVPHIGLPKMNPTDSFSQVLSQVMDKGWNISLAGSNLEARSNYCPFIEDGTIAIGWDGSISPCLPLLHDHVSFMDERQRAPRRYIIGNVNEQNLANAWVLPEHVAFRKKVQAFDFAPCVSCGGCEMAKTNEKDCLGNTFPTCGGCLWAQGVIQCP